MSDDDELTDAEIERYSRQLVLPEFSEAAQLALKRARVLLIGAGGLGAPLGLYLAAAGVGTIGIVDGDRVDLSNLQRQIIHRTNDIGVPKVDSAARAIRALNPLTRVETHDMPISAANAEALIGGYDLVADGSDNFDTRFLVNDACHLLGRTLVSAAILRFDGQVYTFASHRHREGPTGGPRLPCYRCLYPAPPPPGLIPSCSSGGIIGALAGMVGSLQALEVVKELTGLGEGLAGRMLIIDALSNRFRSVRLPADPDCPLCGSHPRITRIGQEAG
ncbi:molybdopterin biosynthesis protein [Tistrella bauzanensis]|uniref:Molybdopterin biosynthesis protein n=1 Tax=Tistrella bauzanensis TaxID=657419 RepID=A0ABQ1IUE4_9PROT|nr:molybdopterin-synthase adenylyltransferase MoeB [Tistrella bauzanensis]GGB52272.1 molybdopterin biosynthesis protein [Tistrella bauzanensis]